MKNQDLYTSFIHNQKLQMQTIGTTDIAEAIHVVLKVSYF